MPQIFFDASKFLTHQTSAIVSTPVRKEAQDAGMVKKPKSGEQFLDRGWVRNAGDQVAERGGTIGGSEEFQHIAGELQGQLGKNALHFKIDGEEAVEWLGLSGDSMARPEMDGWAPGSQLLGVAPRRFGIFRNGQYEMPLGWSINLVQEQSQVPRASRH